MSKPFDLAFQHSIKKITPGRERERSHGNVITVLGLADLLSVDVYLIG